MRKRQKYPLLENLEVIDIGSEGKAIAKKDELVVFVSGAVPGDIVDIQISKKKKNYLEGYVKKFISLSKERIDPVCEHFGVCGGCKWQQLPYKKQLQYKQNQVADNLQRIGHVEIPEISPILPSESTYFYRNKLEYTFSNKRWLTKEEMDIDDENKNLNALGFHIPRKFDKILDINKCWLQPDPSNAIRNSIREYAIKNDLSFYDIRNHSGGLRNVIIRNTNAGDIMVIVAFADIQEEQQQLLLKYISEEFPEITSLMYVINQKKNDTILDLDIKLFKGQDYITETMEGLKYRIGPKSFFQTNSAQAYNLYQVTREFAELKGDETVYDLYTGTGTIANFISSSCKKVVGIEYVPEAIIDAQKNSKINNIKNCEFIAGDIKDIFTQDFIEQHNRPDVIITDPPRVGMHKDVVSAILDVGSEKIVYVSCNPATQARDIEILAEKYQVVKIQPVDMFPNTHHVENVVLLKKRTSTL